MSGRTDDTVQVVVPWLWGSLRKEGPRGKNYIIAHQNKLLFWLLHLPWMKFRFVRSSTDPLVTKSWKAE